MFIRIAFIIFAFLIQINSVFAQTSINTVTLIVWENNSLIINTKSKISYAEAKLKEPDRLVIDLLNCSLENKKIKREYKSDLGEIITISEPSSNQVRIIFSGIASINRKSYLTNNERTLITRIARINLDLEESKISENKEQTQLENYIPGKFKDISIEENDDKTEIVISATKSIKYNTYILKNPDRFAIDLLNILPPDVTLPKLNSTKLVSNIRVGRAASGMEATRIVIDLTHEDLDIDVNPTLVGNKLKIKLKINKQKEELRKRAGIKVIIDPGHGGYDTGASYGGYEEKNINLVISEKLKKNLEEYGITVFLTRDDDSFLSLAERIEITNSIKPNVFISIHNNALVTSRGIHGLETYYWTSKSNKLAFLIHRSILENIKIPDHYIRRARFYVIKYTSSPAVLAELGFLSNPYDRHLLTNSNTQDGYAKALTKAILKFLDIEPKKERDGETGKK